MVSKMSVELPVLGSDLCGARWYESQSLKSSFGFTKPEVAFFKIF